jgi:primase-polymerase (primpol)-like protein
MDKHNEKSPILPVDPEGIPEGLKARPQWLGWRLVPRKDKEKPAKMPENPVTGEFGKTNDPSTWGSFEQAWSYYQSHRDQGVAGVGFVFSKDDPYAGIDLDNCRDPETGELSSFAREVLNRVKSYTEVSPSGTGLHIIVQGKLPGGAVNIDEIELYDERHYLTFTGAALPEFPLSVEEWDVELNALYREAKAKEEARKQQSKAKKEASKPEAKTKKGKAASQPAGANLGPKDARLIAKGKSLYGNKFMNLWDGDYSGYTGGGSQNEADLALSNYLSYLTEGDPREVDRLFRLSGLMRDKWDEVHYADSRTYGQATIELAITDTVEAIEKHKTKPLRATIAPSPSRETDVGNGKRLVANHGKDLRYCHQMKTWLIWTGNRWQVDTTQKIMQYAKATAAAIWEEVDAATDESRRRELVSHARASESHSKLKAMVACAQSEEVVAITPDDLDQNHMLFNCKNGTLDLRTGQFRAHRERT